MVIQAEEHGGNDNIVRLWLKFLDIEEYTQRFLDNGYDDLEIVKLIGEEDLEAIGIDNKRDKEMLLVSVKTLKEQGAAWVYLLLGDEGEDEISSWSSQHSLSMYKNLNEDPIKKDEAQSNEGTSYKLYFFKFLSRMG